MRDFPTRPLRTIAITFGVMISIGAWAALGQSASGQNTSEPGQSAPHDLSKVAPMPVAPITAPGELPDSPAPAINQEDAPVGESSSLPPEFDFSGDGADRSASVVAPGIVAGRVPLNACPDDLTHARECRVHWAHLAATSSLFNAFQNGGNIYTGYWYRYETMHGHWMQRWFDSVTGWKWDRWSDSNPFLDDYVGHPMMGGITNSLWIQDDPKGATVEFGNNHEYWHSRMRATAFSTFYSLEWKFGPFGEAGIGHNGDHLVPQGNGRPWTNETGWVELVTTPVGGLGWTIAEDYLDKHVVSKFEEKPRGAISLLAISFLTPARATANIFRFRPPWYRDGRQVKTSSFWSEPEGPEEASADSGAPAHAAAETSPSGETSAAGAVERGRNAEVLPLWPRYGGVHEFGAWWGASLMTGHIWGYAKDIKYMPVDVTYSYLLNPHGRWSFRYSPEMTALAMLDEPQPGQKNPQFQRKRTYGSGLSPVGFRASFYPESKVQPFLSTNGGFIYFDDRVLSPQGSQFMYTIDFGGGLQFYRKNRQSVTIGYRYQHLSNANISLHNPGTDTNVFYVAVSRFRTKGYR